MRPTEIELVTAVDLRLEELRAQAKAGLTLYRPLRRRLAGLLVRLAAALDGETARPAAVRGMVA